MRKLWEVALNDLRVTFADRSIWIGILVVPIGIIFFIGLANGGFGSNEQAAINVDVYDNDNSTLSAQLIEELRAVNSTLRLCPLDNGEGDPCGVGEEALTPEDSVERVRDGATNAVITIPAGFGEMALAGELINIGYQSEETLGQPSAVLQALQAAAQRVGGASVAARVGAEVYEEGGFAFADEAERDAFQQNVYERADQIWAGLPATVNFQMSGGSSTSGFSQSVPGIGTMYVMGNVLIGSILLVLERKQWTLQRLITMPVSAQQVIGGKMLARFIIGMIQYAIAFGFGFLLGVRYGNSPLAIIAIMLAFTLCSTALALLLATFIKTEQQGGVLLNLVILILAPLGGAWWPLEIVPQWMQVVGHISPIAWAMDGFRSVIFNGGGLPDVVVPVGVLLALTAVMFLIAVRRFKYE